MGNLHDNVETLKQNSRVVECELCSKQTRAFRFQFISVFMCKIRVSITTISGREY